MFHDNTNSRRISRPRVSSRNLRFWRVEDRRRWFRTLLGSWIVIVGLHPSVPAFDRLSSFLRKKKEVVKVSSKSKKMEETNGKILLPICCLKSCESNKIAEKERRGSVVEAEDPSHRGELRRILCWRWDNSQPLKRTHTKNDSLEQWTVSPNTSERNL